MCDSDDERGEEEIKSPKRPSQDMFFLSDSFESDEGDNIPASGSSLLNLRVSGTTSTCPSSLENLVKPEEDNLQSSSFPSSGVLQDPNLSDFINDSEEVVYYETPFDKFKTSLNLAIEDVVNHPLIASIILENDDLRKEIFKQMAERTNENFKATLKHSQLAADKNNRNYLLGITPLGLCREFQTENREVFEIVTMCLLGMKNPEEVFESRSIYQQPILNL